MSLKQAIKEAKEKANIFPRFWEFWKEKTPWERKKIYLEAMEREMAPEMNKNEYAHLLSLYEIVEIMDFCEV